MKLYILSIDNYSQYLRDLVDNDRTLKRDPEIIRRKIEEHQQIIRDLKELKKAKPLDQNKINDLLKYHAPNYKNNAVTRTELQRHKFIEKAILPELKKLGFTGSPNDLDEILLNYPDNEE